MARAEVIRSPANPLLKSVRRALSRGAPTEDGFWAAETFHLLEEALRSEREVAAVLAAESVQNTVESHVKGLRVRVVIVADGLFQNLSQTESSQGVIALVRPPAWTVEQLFRGRGPAVVLDGVQDPGNAGSIVRAAEAFGASGVLFLKGTVAPHNPKLLRGSAGSMFRMPFVDGIDVPLARAALRQAKLEVYAAVPPRAGTLRLQDADLARPCAIVIGSEARGVSPELRRGARELSIPTLRVESLNAAAAAAILLYEAARQRLPKP
jgi:TrmH family RNA methyltransferase